MNNLDHSTVIHNLTQSFNGTVISLIVHLDLSARGSDGEVFVSPEGWKDTLDELLRRATDDKLSDEALDVMISKELDRLLADTGCPSQKIADFYTCKYGSPDQSTKH